PCSPVSPARWGRSWRSLSRPTASSPSSPSASSSASSSAASPRFRVRSSAPSSSSSCRISPIRSRRRHPGRFPASSSSPPCMWHPAASPALSGWRRRGSGAMQLQPEKARHASFDELATGEERMQRGLWTAPLALLAMTSWAVAADAPGVTSTEIKIGQTMPYSGPASAYGTIGKAEAAVFKMINEQGGINGRKIHLISLDDGYSPPKTVEQLRRLVEQEDVAFIFQSLGTPTNTAIQKYLNGKKVPQLFVATGASKWGDPEHFHWTIGWQPDYRTEARIYAKYILKNKPDSKI